MEPVIVRHTVPTHLQVQDRMVFGMTVGQLVALMGAAAVAYWLYVHQPLWPLNLRVVLMGPSLLAGAVLALVRPLGRDLVSWGALLARYAAKPKRAVWRPSMRERR